MKYMKIESTFLFLKGVCYFEYERNISNNYASFQIEWFSLYRIIRQIVNICRKILERTNGLLQTYEAKALQILINGV